MLKNMDIPIQTVEFKWAGYIMPYASIMPKSFRAFDAFFVSHADPKNLMFNIYTDSTQFIPRINGPGEYEFTFVVICENFPPVRERFKVRIGNALNEVSLTMANSYGKA
jgi:hypothetical protein